MLSKLKEKVQSLLSVEAKLAHTIGLTPNIVSMLGLLFSILSAILYLLSFNQPWFLLLAAVLILTSGFCDVLDGILARTYDQESIFGGFFDSLLDRYSDLTIFVGIIMGGLCDPVLGFFALIGSFLVSYTRARAESVGIKMSSVGLMERAERLLLLIVASIFAFFWLPALNIGVALLAFLSNFTVIERAFYVHRILKKKI